MTLTILQEVPRFWDELNSTRGTIRLTRVCALSFVSPTGWPSSVGHIGSVLVNELWPTTFLSMLTRSNMERRRSGGRLLGAAGYARKMAFLANVEHTSTISCTCHKDTRTHARTHTLTHAHTHTRTSQIDCNAHAIT